MPKRKSIDFASLQKRWPIDEIGEDQILFYDIETDHQYAPYAKLNQIGVQYGFEGTPIVLHSLAQKSEFARKIADPSIIKVGFNNRNFDDIVLAREGYEFNLTNHHDGYLMIKAITAILPSYSLKFVCWYMLGDYHWEQGKVERFQVQSQEHDFSKIPPHLLGKYHKHDIKQHMNVFCMAWEKVQKEPHWSAYNLDLGVTPAIQEMTLQGGLDVDLQLCKQKIQELEEERFQINARVEFQTDGYITNANSSRQVADWLDVGGFEMALTENGEWQLSKKELVDLRSKDPIAEQVYRIREIIGTVKYFKAYDRAATEGATGNLRVSAGGRKVRIPRSYGTSVLRTRRFGSSSMYGINFQNPSDDAKIAHLVPRGYLGVWFDASSIENVVHIYESEDNDRRESYEADPNWNEYVWLCNTILGGTSHTKNELDDKETFPHPTNPTHSFYKGTKMVKLGLNFGMGPRKYSKETGLDLVSARESFDMIHDACPAIRNLQNKVANLLRRYGQVQDVFGHIYSGPIEKAYKVVAYFIQGCGTGSLPKAQIRANWETLQHRNRGIMCGTTHDDNSCRLPLDLGPSDIIATLQEMQYNMTEMFSPRFDNIPLRAKCYLSRTTEADKMEVNLKDPKTYAKFLK